jgi:hypothetical protein
LDGALAHVEAAARSAGLAAERREVVAVPANVLVRVEPGPIAARLTGATAPFRDAEAFLRREAALATALAEAGAPVLAPLAGPLRAGGRVVTRSDAAVVPWSVFGPIAPKSTTWSPRDRAHSHTHWPRPRGAASARRTTQGPYASARSTCRVSYTSSTSPSFTSW